MVPPNVRSPAVAGTFYPGEAGALRAEVEELLAGARPPPGDPSSPRQGADLPEALIAPHAGYVYSGPIAASAFARLAAAAGAIRRVVLLGPSHFVPVAGLALPAADAFATPLGEIEIDRRGVADLAALPQVSIDRDAHAREHALEVELPFLQCLLGEFLLLPLVVGEADAETVAEVLEAAWGGDETVVVVSSDLSHYLPYDQARAADRRTAEAILALAPPLAAAQACGARPIGGLLAAARRRRLEPSLIDLRNSGDTAGPRDQVVGYGAFAFDA